MNSSVSVRSGASGPSEFDEAINVDGDRVDVDGNPIEAPAPVDLEPSLSS